MKTLKKAGLLSAATTLAVGVMFAGLSTVANAAPVTVSVDSDELEVGQTVQLTVDGCSVGAELYVLDGTSAEPEAIIVEEDTLPLVVNVAHDSFAPDGEFYEGGEVEVGAACIPPLESDEEPTEAYVPVYVHGSWLEADPREFQLGDPVDISAGDFVAGETVVLNVYPQGTETSVFSFSFGAAGEDRTVSGTVLFPQTLECGTYDVVITGGEQRIATELYLCGVEPTPTPTTTPTAVPTVTPTETAVPTPTPTVSETATAAPTSRPQPGLPSTGN